MAGKDTGQDQGRPQQDASVVAYRSSQPQQWEAGPHEVRYVGLHCSNKPVLQDLLHMIVNSPVLFRLFP